jgi:hypothetical protein
VLDESKDYILGGAVLEAYDVAAWRG